MVTVPVEKRPVIRAVLGSSAEIYAATVAKVFCAWPSPKMWSDYSLVGAMVLLRDTSLNSALFLKLVDIKAQSVIWSHEIYEELVYHKDSDFFFSFASDEFMVGICFMSEEEAQQFRDVLERKRGRVGQVPGAKGWKKKSWMRIKLGAPANLKHVSHIGHRVDGKIEKINIPRKWMDIIKSAGLTEEQLEDKNTMDFALDFIQQNESALAPNGTRAMDEQPQKQEELMSELEPEPGQMDSKSGPPFTKKQSVPTSTQSPPLQTAPKRRQDTAQDEPPQNGIHSMLMSDIRSSNISQLKKAPTMPKSQPGLASPKGDVMSEMLAKALEARTRMASRASEDRDY